MSAYSETKVCQYTVDLDRIKPGFPKIIDDVTLSFMLGIRAKTFWHQMTDVNAHKGYDFFNIPQLRDDGTLKKLRPIQAPNDTLKYIQKRLNYVFAGVPLSKSVGAYVRGRPMSAAAAQHVRPSFSFPKDKSLWTPEQTAKAEELEKDRRYAKKTVEQIVGATSTKFLVYHQPIVAIHLDIENFFNSIHRSWLRNILEKDVGYSNNVAGLIASIATVSEPIKLKCGTVKAKRYLPQGSPSSCSMSNIVAYYAFGKMIEEVLRIDSPDWVYTIYSDDIIISHPSKTVGMEKVVAVKDTVIRIIEDKEFVINHKKTWIRYSEKERINVLGFTVTDKLNIPRQAVRSVQGMLHRCQAEGVEKVSRDYGKSVLHLIQEIRGGINYIKTVKPILAANMLADLETLVALLPREITVVSGGKDATGHDKIERVTPAKPESDDGAIPF